MFKKICKKNKSLLLILIFLLLISSGAPFAAQYTIKSIIFLLEEKSIRNVNIVIGKFIELIIFYAVITILKNMSQNLQHGINRSLGLELTNIVQELLVEKIKKIEYKSFWSQNFQDLYSIILENSKSEPMIFVFSIFRVLLLLVQVLGNLIIIFNLNILVLVILIFFTIFFNLFINIKIEKSHVKVWDDYSGLCRLNDYYLSVLTRKQFIKELRLFNLNNYFLKNKNENFVKTSRLWHKFIKKEAILSFLAAITISLGMLISIIWLIFQVIVGNYSISDFVFYSTSIVSLETSCSSFVSEISAHYKSVLFINKLLHFLDLNNEIKSGKRKVLNKSRHTLEFKNISFSYPNSSELTLKNINFKIKTGEIISLVGKNGCGKTTLIYLILKIYKPQTGKILLDGVNIEDYDYKSYLSFFSAIFQDYQKYAVKLYDYISFGSIKEPENKLNAKKALEKATISSNFLNKLPNGLDANLTKIFDEQGLELSGGQWQKLAISRVFFSKAGMLIFDEPSSALDAISESKIYENISKNSKDKIVIFISHRMYSSKLANRIIYMENGKIIGDGSHDKLIRQSAGYKNLYNEQANKYTMLN